MLDETAFPSTFWPGRRWRIGLNVLLSVLALLSVVIMANYLAARHFRRFEWRANHERELSPLTVRVLESITNTVRIVLFYNPREPLYGAVGNLLDEFQVRCPRLAVEHLDYILHPGRAEEVRKDYRLAPSDQGDRIIFDCNGKTKVVYAHELSEFDYSAALSGKEVKRTTFKGEQHFVSALYGVIDPQPLAAYFLQGSGEHDPADNDDQRGYSEFARILIENNIVVKRLSLHIEDIPADCRLLIVANPTSPLPATELEKIERYLNVGGRMLVLLSHESVGKRTGLENLLSNWGVEVSHNRVLDHPQGKSGDALFMNVNAFGDHALVKPLRRSRLALIVPRSVRKRAARSPSAATAQVVELAFTSPQGVASDGAGRVEGPGAIPLMAAVEARSIPGITADQGATRLVVVGESLFLANTGIQAHANRDFARLAVHWLLSRDLLLEGIGPRAVKEYTVLLTSSEMKSLCWLFLGGFPGGILLLGTLVWLRRRV